MARAVKEATVAELTARFQNSSGAVLTEYRGLTVGDLAKKAGTTAQIITDLETGAAELSDKWLRRLAPALSTRAGLLLDVAEPTDANADILEVVEAIPKERRGQALEILRTFRTYNRLR